MKEFKESLLIKLDYQYKLEYMRLNWYYYHDWFNFIYDNYYSKDIERYILEIDKMYKSFGF